MFSEWSEYLSLPQFQSDHIFKHDVYKACLVAF